MKVKKWLVVSPKPELVTLQDGSVVSLPKGHEPVELRMDSRFKRLDAARKLQPVFVEVDDEEEVDEDVQDSTETIVEFLAAVSEDVSEPSEERSGLIADTGLRASLASALRGAGIETLENLREKVEADGLPSLLEIHGVGEGSLDDIEALLEVESN